MNYKSKLRSVLKILPTDYDLYGGQVKRWDDPNKDYPDCSRGCKYAVKIDSDWLVCTNPESPRAGLLTWEHQAGLNCFDAEENE